MRSLSVTKKTALLSSFLALFFLGASGIIFTNIFQVIIKNSANITLQSQLSTLSVSLEALTPGNTGDGLDPLPPGQLAVVRNDSGVVLLNSFAKTASLSVLNFESLPLDRLERVEIDSKEFWAIRSYVPSPTGRWEVVVSQSNQFNQFLSHKIVYLLFGFGAFLSLIIWLGSLLLSIYVLKPVKKMRIKAQTLVTNEVHEYLPISDADDEISRLAETLNKLLGKLHSSLDRQGQLVADVSHELRTPLAILQSRLELVISKEDRDLNKVELIRVLDSARKLTEILNQILHLARNPVPASQQRSTPQEIEILLLNTVDNLRLISSTKAITIDLKFEVDHPVQIGIDGLERIIINVVANAIASIGADGEIEIKMIQGEAETVLTVQDSGKGFDPDFVPVSVERFLKSDEIAGREIGGFGLGLSLVKVIVDSCGGDMELSNVPDGHGALVTIKLRNKAENLYRKVDSQK